MVYKICLNNTFISLFCFQSFACVSVIQQEGREENTKTSKTLKCIVRNLISK